MVYAIGQCVQARDALKDWYDAKMIAVKGEAEVTHIKVHYNGWNGWKPRRDEWIEVGERTIGEDEKIPDDQPYLAPIPDRPCPVRLGHGRRASGRTYACRMHDMPMHKRMHVWQDRCDFRPNSGQVDGGGAAEQTAPADDAQQQLPS